MGVETELFGIKNRGDGKEFRVVEKADGSIAVYAGDVALIEPGKIPVTATPSAQGVGIRGIAPSGTVAADGAITLGTALPGVFAQISLYLPAGAIVGGAAGFYAVEMSSTTVGVVRAVFGGAALVGSASAYTGVTTEVTLDNYALALPLGRSALCRFSAAHTNSAGTKTSRVKYNGNQVYTVSGTTAAGQSGAVTGDGICPGQQAWAQAAASGVTSLITFTAEDASEKTLTVTGQLSAATDAFVLVHSSLIVKG